jgi:hypothetical protein
MGSVEVEGVTVGGEGAPQLVKLFVPVRLVASWRL